MINLSIYYNSQAHALLVWETCAEYERQNLGKLGLDMEKLLMIIPTNRALIFDKCATFDNCVLKQDCLEPILPPLSTTTRGKAAATKTRKALLSDPHTPCDLPLSPCSYALEAKGCSCSKSKNSSSARLASSCLSGKPRWIWRQTGKLAARG